MSCRLLPCVVHVVNSRVFPALTNTRFKNESMTVQILFWNMLYEMSHGFDITHELLVVDWHFKNILCFAVLLFYRSNTFSIECILYK